MAHDIAARFNDGRTAAAHDVTVRVTPAGLEIRGADGLLLAFWTVADLQSDDHGTRMRCRSEPDARLTLPDAQVMRLITPFLPAAAGRRWFGWAVAVSAVASAVIAAGLYVGIPAASRQLAVLVPPAIEAEWGKGLSEGLEKQWGACRAPAGDAALAFLAARLGAPLPEVARPRRVVVVRHKDENALALPGGSIMIFQGLLDRAQGPDEVAGVLAHEMTHVSERHVTAAAIRGLGIGMVATLVTGDASGLLAGGAITLLAGSYSREDETAADAGAVALLARAGISPAGMTAFFQRMSAGSAFPQWLSTHPDPKARAAAITAAARPGPTAPALSPEQWVALKGICGA